LNCAELAERFGHGELAFVITDSGEDLKRLQVDFVVRVTSAGIEVGSDYLVDAGRGFALDLKLGRELRGEVFVKELFAAIHLYAK
jgi:hypothetical protein